MFATLGLVATDIYLPSFPFIQSTFSTSKSLVQLSLSLYLFSLSLSQIVYGPISDRYGRRNVALISLAIGLAGTVLCLFAPNIFTLIAGRFFQGLGFGAGATLGRAILRDVYSGNELAHFGSLIAIGTSIRMALAPILGGYIQLYLGWRYNFLFICIYTAIAFVAIWRKLPETHKELNVLAMRFKTFTENYLHLLTSPVFMGYSCCAGLGFAGLSAYFASSPYLFEKIIGLSAVTYGWMALFLALGLSVGGYCNKRLIPHLGKNRLLALGTALLFLSGVLMWILALFGWINLSVILVPMFFYTFGLAMTFANSFAGAFHPFGKIAGFAGALYSTLQILGGALATGIIAATNEKNQIPLAIVCTIVGALAFFSQRMAFRSSAKADASH